MHQNNIFKRGINKNIGSYIVLSIIASNIPITILFMTNGFANLGNKIDFIKNIIDKNINNKNEENKINEKDEKNKEKREFKKPKINIYVNKKGSKLSKEYTDQILNNPNKRKENKLELNENSNGNIPDNKFLKINEN